MHKMNATVGVTNHKVTTILLSQMAVGEGCFEPEIMELEPSQQWSSQTELGFFRAKLPDRKINFLIKSHNGEIQYTDLKVRNGPSA